MRHGGPVKEIGGSLGDGAIANVLWRAGGVSPPCSRMLFHGGLTPPARHTHVDDKHMRSLATSKHIDRGTAAQKVSDHLMRDFLRVGTDAFGNDAVIGS